METIAIFAAIASVAINVSVPLRGNSQWKQENLSVDKLEYHGRFSPLAG